MAAALFDLKHEITAKVSSISPYSQRPHPKEYHPWLTLGPWRTVGERWQITYQYQSRSYTLALQPRSTSGDGDTWAIQIDSRPSLEVAATLYHDALIQLRFGARIVRAYVEQINGETQVIFAAKVYRLHRRQPPDVRRAAHGSITTHIQKTLTAPMAGTIVNVQVQDGSEVEPHQVLMVLNAMKMEHAIIAPYAGKILHVFYQEGVVVKGGAVLIELE